MLAKRFSLNLVFGITSQLIIITLGVFIPKLLLDNFGSEVNGLIQSISQIIIYFSLFEAGVGAASIQALYGPISRGDKKNINEILAATSLFYKKTGILYFVAVVLLALIYPIIINSDIDKTEISFIILFTGLGGAFDYFFQGKYRIYLTAEGKSYIIALVATIMSIITNGTKIVLLLLGKDIIVVQASFFLLSIIKVVIFQIYIRKNYKWIDLSVYPDKKAISQKNSVFIHQISTLVFSNTDVLILTVLTNLKVVSVYVLYNMFFTIIDNLINTIKGSLTFALGQTYHSNRAKFMKLFDAYEIYIMSLVFSLFSITYILILPFLELYTAGVNDIKYVDNILPILFVMIKLIVTARTSGNVAINIAGHFKKTQNRSIFESILNLSCSIFLVNSYGIYGVLLGTLIAVTYRSIDIVIYSNKIILERSPWITIKRWITNIFIFLVIIVIYNQINFYPSSYVSIFLSGFILIITILPCYILINSLFELESFVFTKKMVFNYIKKIRGNKITP